MDNNFLIDKISNQSVCSFGFTINSVSEEAYLEVDKIISKYVSDKFHVMSIAVSFVQKTTSWVLLKEYGESPKNEDIIKEIKGSIVQNSLSRYHDLSLFRDSPYKQRFIDKLVELSELYNLATSVSIKNRDNIESSSTVFKYPLVIFETENNNQKVPFVFLKKFRDHLLTIDPKFCLGVADEIIYKVDKKIILNLKVPNFDMPLKKPRDYFLLSLKEKGFKIPPFLKIKILLMSDFLMPESKWDLI